MKYIARLELSISYEPLVDYQQSFPRLIIKNFVKEIEIDKETIYPSYFIFYFGGKKTVVPPRKDGILTDGKFITTYRFFKQIDFRASEEKEALEIIDQLLKSDWKEVEHLSEWYFI
jgi:hypothetical protein